MTAEPEDVCGRRPLAEWLADHRANCEECQKTEGGNE